MAAPTSRSRRSQRRARTRLDPEVRREQIIDAAERVLARRPPADVTFELVADAAEVSRGLVYNYFGDKGGLLAAVYLRSFERLTADVGQSAPDATGTTEEHLRALVDAYVHFVADDACTRTLLATPEAMEHPAVRRARRDHVAALATIWGGSPEARILASGVVGFLEAAALEWLEDAQLAAEPAAEVIYAQLWSGLAAQDGTTVSTARQQYHAATLR